MSTPNKYKPENNTEEKSGIGEPPPGVTPICPHCEKDLTIVGHFAWKTEHMVILAIYCAHCKTALHWGIVPGAPMQPGSGLTIEN